MYLHQHSVVSVFWPLNIEIYMKMAQKIFNDNYCYITISYHNIIGGITVVLINFISYLLLKKFDIKFLDPIIGKSEWLFENEAGKGSGKTTSISYEWVNVERMIARDTNNQLEATC
jgi:hypothetical protein